MRLTDLARRDNQRDAVLGLRIPLVTAFPRARLTSFNWAEALP